MKRWIIWLLILVLALSGCAGEESNTTNPTTVPQSTTPPVSLYISGTPWEKSTDGAVKVYSAGGTINGITRMEEDMVVLTFDGTNTTITRLTTDEGIVIATATCSGLLEGDAVATAENKLVYYNREDSCVVVLNDRLNQIDRLDLPKDITGTPVFSQDLTTAFYCVGNEIRGLNLSSGIARLVCQLNMQQVQMVGLLMDDTVIHCYATDTHGRSYHVFYSSTVGEYLGSDETLSYIQSWGENYLLRRTDGPVTEVLVGKKNTLQIFEPANREEMLTVLAGNHAAAEITHKENGDGIVVYEMTEGKAVGALNLEGATDLRLIVEDPNGQYLWFCAKDSEGAEDILCRWEIQNQGDDNVVRIGKRYTAQDPDVDGLAECAKLANEIGQKYGVNILITDMKEPEDYSFVPEYQVEAIRNALQTLDDAFACFPNKFFSIVATTSENPKLQISLVRGFQPNRYDVPEENEGLQYWIKNSAYISLVVCDDIEQNFYHELCHAMDTYVYTHSSQYDFWTTNNPEGFQYDGNYNSYTEHEGSPYLQGEERAFIDAYSMTFAYEDRATVFEYAMMEGNAEYFSSEIMQYKLTILCKGIRRAFGWRYNENTYPWEQYLKESQAYVKDKK